MRRCTDPSHRLFASNFYNRLSYLFTVQDSTTFYSQFKFQISPPDIKRLILISKTFQKKIQSGAKYAPYTSPLLLPFRLYTSFLPPKM
jgi:hypothetical protein